MRVAIPTPLQECAASLTCRAEGIDYEIGLCDGIHDYGKHLARWWSEGTGFILVEWDIAPWPGALRAMWDCEHDHCGYQCPLDRELACWLNCVKFSSVLTRRYPNFPTELRWAEIPWNELGGSVCLPVRAIADGIHEHYPPVAHVRGLPVWRFEDIAATQGGWRRYRWP